MICKNLKELEQELYKRINTALDTDVANTIKNVMSNHIRDDVYNKHKPKYYSRRGSNGGLADTENLKATLSELFVQNVTLGSKTFYSKHAQGYVPSGNANKFITPIIESGVGYDAWDDAFPRPYVQNTHDDLEQNHYHTEAMKRSLKKQGLEVK